MLSHNDSATYKRKKTLTLKKKLQKNSLRKTFCTQDFITWEWTTWKSLHLIFKKMTSRSELKLARTMACKVTEKCYLWRINALLLETNGTYPSWKKCQEMFLAFLYMVWKTLKWLLAYTEKWYSRNCEFYGQ